MLTNERDTLPLNPSVRALAAIGPLAAAATQMGGPWSLAGAMERLVSVHEGLCEALPQAQVLHAAGVDTPVLLPAGAEPGDFEGSLESIEVLTASLRAAVVSPSTDEAS